MYAFDAQVAPIVPLIPRYDYTDVQTTRSALVAARAARRPFVLPEAVTVTEHVVDVPGAASVAVHVYAPRDATGAPVVVWFHGGGFLIGDARMDAWLHALLVEGVGAVVVSVEYSLAPEHAYPTALDEGIAVLDWVARDGAGLGIDTTRVAIGGQSAGGCLAAAIALRARDAGAPRIAAQILDFPVVDDRRNTPSMAYDDTPSWTFTNAGIGWAGYLGGQDAAQLPYASPARVDDLTGLPPAYLTACQFDPLRDEAVDYAQRLAQAGVPTELHLYPGTFHGSSVVAATAKVSQRMRRDLVEAVARLLGGTADAR